jgi:hypothetical protein
VSLIRPKGFGGQAGVSLLATGHWLLASGHWFMVAGHWQLASGRRSLVAGSWLQLMIRGNWSKTHDNLLFASGKRPETSDNKLLNNA